MFEWEIMLKSEAEMTHAKINCFFINSTQSNVLFSFMKLLCFQQTMDFYPELIFMIYRFYSQYFIIICVGFFVCFKKKSWTKFFFFIMFSNLTIETQQ